MVSRFFWDMPATQAIQFVKIILFGRLLLYVQTVEILDEDNEQRIDRLAMSKDTVEIDFIAG